MHAYRQPDEHEFFESVQQIAPEASQPPPT